jgi:hypothetical protein
VQSGAGGLSGRAITGTALILVAAAAANPPEVTRRAPSEQTAGGGVSRAALEVLAIVAYRQPIARSGIEHIRGSASDSAIVTLLERGLIAHNPHHLFVTTREFLDYAGLRDLAAAPERRAAPGHSAPPTPAADPSQATHAPPRSAPWIGPTSTRSSLTLSPWLALAQSTPTMCAAAARVSVRTPLDPQSVGAIAVAVEQPAKQWARHRPRLVWWQDEQQDPV